jgi:hypothetical protein
MAICDRALVGFTFRALFWIMAAMNEISRCCRVLHVNPGASLEEVKEAYRDLVQIWHPDRFSEKERLQNRAREQLKEINLAYDYLMAHAFHDGVLVEPAEEDAIVRQDVEPATTQTSDSPHSTSADVEPPVDSGREPRQRAASPKRFWVIAGLVVIFMAVTLLFMNSHRRASPAIPIQKINNTAVAMSNPESVSATVAQTNSAPENAFPNLYAFRLTFLGRILKRIRMAGCNRGAY